MGCLGTCLGSWIKATGVHPDTFYVVFIGQAIVAASQVFILALPTKLAAVWFGPDQVSSACGLGVFGNQVSRIEHVFSSMNRRKKELLFLTPHCTRELLSKVSRYKI